ncbi:hypothetical protein AB0F36_14295 [Streptomyces sp. NPDC029080]|uniref:hypothetical protein n=1 Tax=Streptomyces sp. NPDC029080 TaxID=3155017 RepID=UPI003402CF33
MTSTTATVGQAIGTLTCCGKPMKHLGDEIFECTRCDCYVIGDDDVIEKVAPCKPCSRR